MLARINTVAFNGLEILNVDLQVQISSGLPAFTIVGLPDKAVAESRERVRAALQSLGLSLPAKRITVNLAPADLLKEGSHFDLPVALGLLIGMGILPQEELSGYFVLGELGLDGSIVPVNGVLPVAIKAYSQNKGLICPSAQGSEAVWSGLKDILAPHNPRRHQPLQRKPNHSFSAGFSNNRTTKSAGYERRKRTGKCQTSLGNRRCRIS